MDNSRRDFLKLSATAAAIGALLPNTPASAQSVAGAPAAPPAVPTATSGALRLVTFAPDITATPRVGIVKANGHVVDLTSAKGSLSFDPTSMVSLIAAGPSALDEVRKIAAEAPDSGPAVSSVRLLPPVPN